MDGITIPDLDDTVLDALKRRAGRNGRTVEEEAREILRYSVEAQGAIPGAAEERERRVRAILALGRRLDEPFDLKGFSAALSEGRG